MSRRNLKILLLSIAIVISLTALQHKLRPSLFFYFLYPGNVIELIITGGHGGSHTEEALAPMLGFLINVCAYWLIGLFAVRAVRGTDAPGRREKNLE